MKATKYILNVEVEVLSKDCIPSLLAELIRNIDEENLAGTIVKDDGDTFTWETKSKEVEF